ncbi:ion transporter [Pseudomonas songnenensis]|uniref:Ion transporter n=1 Tax=Pseudomonas songnenensis TaxID=1176259 RepID=A0ABX9V1E0_9PSED|nr:ion transporter [Pseudomonas songnenensis]AWM60349.1 ion transporter [Stutzerimonas stutzeri]MCQ4301087.1 ion transporter [Pseudomonas songnenensis]RMH99556.1 ion transporter [Pseudomonas songnenensis]
MQATPVETSTRSRLKQLIERPAVQRGILLLIVINAAILGMQTSPSLVASWGELLSVLDMLILGVFVVEIAARIYVHRAAFFRDPWSLFDFTVVAIALVPASGPFSVLRALRVLRVMRMVTMVPSMRRVVGALLSAIPGLGSIAMVLALVFYVSAVIATGLFGAEFPEWFGNLGRSVYTLFQVMTLESWSMGIVRPLMDVFPYAWVFFIPFILIATFTMLNLFIAIIVNAMQTVTDADHEATQATIEAAREHIEADLHEEVRALRGEIAELKELLRGQARH